MGVVRYKSRPLIFMFRVQEQVAALKQHLDSDQAKLQKIKALMVKYTLSRLV